MCDWATSKDGFLPWPNLPLLSFGIFFLTNIFLDVYISYGFILRFLDFNS